ncbi:MAG: hypothetical protein ABWY66_12010 [Xanthobacteraceae bacterium]|jgi:hypothetical protein
MTDNKYDLLRDHLKSHVKDELVMTFDEIEEILGFGLPRAAQRAEWWFDDTPEHPRLQRIAVRDAGYDAKRLPDGKGVRFSKISLAKRR